MLKNIIKTLIYLLFVTFITKTVFALFSPTLYTLISSDQAIQALLWGVRFDFTIISILATLCFLIFLFINLFKKSTGFALKFPIAIALIWIVITTLADHLYFITSSRHMTFELFLGEGSELELIKTAIFNFPIQVLSASLILVISFIILNKIKFYYPYENGKARALVYFFLLWPVVAITSIRGGWIDAPQSPMSIYKINDNNLASLAWNAPYSITYYLSKGKNKAAKQFTPTLSLKEKAILKKNLGSKKTDKITDLKQTNIIIVLLESWAASDMKSYGNDLDVTPYFDSLRKKSFTTHAMYTNGFRTVEGMFSTLCSYPNPVGGGVAGTQLQNGQFKCLPHILKDQGWETYFIQGGTKGIIGSFAQTLGLENSLGKKDYGFTGEHNYWGYMDDSIYKFTLNKLKSSKFPALITVNTGSTHDEHLPDGVTFKFGKKDHEQLRKSVLHNADQDLKIFITELKKTTKKPTLVVLVSDHTAGIASDGVAQESLAFLMLGINTKIPTANRNISSSQRDIAPTVLDLLGGHASWFTGHSLLDPKYDGFADFTKGKTFSYIKKNKLINLASDTGKMQSCFKIKSDTITLTKANCSNKIFQSNKQKAKNYLFYSQQLLFEGKTKEY